jgi:hypothetical protein
MAATPHILDGSFMKEWNDSAMSSSFSSYAVGFVMKLGREGSGVEASGDYCQVIAGGSVAVEATQSQGSGSAGRRSKRSATRG